MRPSSRKSARAGGDITVWLSGTYAGATPGQHLSQVAGRDRRPVQAEEPRLERQVRPDADQQRAVHGADRRGVRVEARPRRDARLLGRLHDAVHAELAGEAQRPRQRTAGFYASQTAWDLSCLNLNCKGGKGDIYAIPNDEGTYALYYNKALFRKAGIATPPTTYNELLADCKIFKSKGILPLAYGDRDGYSTDNWVTYDYASYMAPGDIAKVNDGKMKYTDPKLVKPLEQLAKFKQQGCVNPDASTHENNDANTYFTSGKAAMVQMFPFVIKAFEQALGKNLGLAKLPQSGPHPGRTAANSFHNWVIPKNAKNKDGGWEFIQMAVDKKGATDLANLVGALPTNKAVLAAAKDPFTKFFVAGRRNPQVPLLDSIVPAEGGAALLRAAAVRLLGQGRRRSRRCRTSRRA